MLAHLQIRRLCRSLTETAPEGAALEEFLAHPNHVLARVCREISQPDVVVASLDKPMQVISRTVSSPLLAGSIRVPASHNDGCTHFATAKSEQSLVA